MKKFVLLLCLSLFAFSLTAQDNYYFPTEEGTVLTYKNYNAKGKPDKNTSWYTYTINKVEKKGDVTHVFFTVNFEGKEKFVKDAPSEMKNIFDNMEVVIEKDVMKIEFFNSIVGKLTAAAISTSTGSGMTATTSGSSIKVFPLNAEVGATIPDTELKVNMSMSAQGINVSTTQTTSTYNSKVVAKEDITTPAGTFACIKISEKIKYTIGVGSMTMQNIDAGSNTWLAKNVGFVRMETLDKKGKLESYLLLDKIEKK